MPRYYHVTSVLNRESISEHGLDWTRMGAASGIAGSQVPEEQGIFLCSDYDLPFFLRINNTGGPVDVWGVDGVDDTLLEDNGNGFFYVPERVPASRISLLQQDVPEQDFRSGGFAPSR